MAGELKTPESGETSKDALMASMSVLMRTDIDAIKASSFDDSPIRTSILVLRPSPSSVNLNNLTLSAQKFCQTKELHGIRTDIDAIKTSFDVCTIRTSILVLHHSSSINLDNLETLVKAQKFCEMKELHRMRTGIDAEKTSFEVSPIRTNILVLHLYSSSDNLHHKYTESTKVL